MVLKHPFSKENVTNPPDGPNSKRRSLLSAMAAIVGQLTVQGLFPTRALANTIGAGRLFHLRFGGPGKLFEGVGVANAGATSVLLKDYPEPQRSQLLDLVFKPMFGASVSALLVEIPGDGNSTQGSMPSHMHTRDDLNYQRGYMWWIIKEARKRNPELSLDATAWSAPGWIGGGEFWSADAADYYVRWLEGLRRVYGIELDAIGCRNEKGVDYTFAKTLRAALDAAGFDKVRLHAFDNWQDTKLDFVKDMQLDAELRDAIDILGAHVFHANAPASAEVQAMAAQMGKPIWNTEEHVYKDGFDCAISIVRAFNDNYIRSGATRIVNWYDIAALYPLEPFSVQPAMVLAHEPWSGHYQVREALWGYAHYGQFSQVGWRYLDAGCGMLEGGGTIVTLCSTQGEYSIIAETRDAGTVQELSYQAGEGLSAKPLHVWRSNAQAQFVQLGTIEPVDGRFSLALEPNCIYSFTTTRGQRKGSFPDIPLSRAFPFPYRETFEDQSAHAASGYLPRYTADIAGAFELVKRPDGKRGTCIRQVVPIATISWAPDWQPYTILGDEAWRDYEVGVEVYLNPRDKAAVMGRINHVGTGYGFIPKGYFLELSSEGQCRLVLIRGKPDPKKVVGDAEQQALIRAGKHEGEGGELVLGEAVLTYVGPQRWHRLSLRFEGDQIIGMVDGKQVLSARNTLYERGMVGMMAGAEGKRLSTPYFDNIVINRVGETTPKPSKARAAQKPIY